jgi:predicted Rossmann fold nucleotide-binding protein DprA/Smf involved in DNA uptake
LLLLSFFSDAQVRPTVEFALQRNRLVSALAGQVLIVHAPQASRTWDLAVSGMEEINGEYTLPDPANDALMEKGVEVFPEFGKYE